jgi:uncharacterized protein YjbI with pentapeptide repeats
MANHVTRRISRLYHVRPHSMASGDFERSLLARYATGERDFRDLDLDDRTYDFSEVCLAGVDFSGSFIFSDFREADLAGARFNRCNVKTCDFRGANLTGATFEGAAIDAADFRGANLSGTIFTGATEQGHIYAAGERPGSV